MVDRDPYQLLHDYGPSAALSAIVVFLAWIRLKPRDRILQGDTVFFSGNDPWYHSRIVHFAVEHFPATPNFDPWSFFPYGTGRHSGFGGLFDQLVALAAIVVGGGNPTPHTINVVVALAPVAFGAATAVPVYLIARRLTDRWSGLLAAGLLALAGGQFLSRTVIGSADHQSAEALFAALAVWGVLYPTHVAYREKPTIADLKDRNWIVLRRPLVAGVVGGFAIASYLMMWPQGVMLLVPFGLFVVIQLIHDHLEGVPTEYLTIAMVATMLSGAVPTLLYAKRYILNQDTFTLLQPAILIGIAAGAVVLLALSEYFTREDYDTRYYPIAVVGLIAGTVALLAVVFPLTIDLWRGLIIRVYSFGIFRGESALTVAEVQPGSVDAAFRAFGAVVYIAAVGFVVMLARVVRERRPRELLVVLWSLAIISAYASMIRFGYYFAVNVVVLAGFAIWWTTRNVLSLDASIREPADVEVYQIIGVLIIVIAVVPGNVVAMQDRQPVWEQAGGYGGMNQAWHNEASWLRSNTPEPPLEYQGRYAHPEDGDFDYPDGAYGVMSWWDYGHYITTIGHRIPNANPFQQGPEPASAYLQAQSEERANLLLEGLPSSGNIHTFSNEELRSMIEEQSEQAAGEDTRYVMIDDQMAAGKFGAIATWTGPGYSSYVSSGEFQLRNGETVRIQGLNDRYRNTMLSRLYFGDASGLNHYRLVHETESETTFVSVAQERPDGIRTTGIINRRLSGNIFNAVQSRSDLFFYDVRRAARVKTFERVDGATLSGTVESQNATTVIATLRLRTNTGRNFTYLQQVETDEDGRFSITVPYPTTDEVSPADGGTNSAVTATGEYTLFAGNPFQPTARGSVAVPEPAVYDGETIAVELEPVETGNRSGANASSLAQQPLPGAHTDAGQGAADRGGADRPDASSEFGATSARSIEPARLDPINAGA